MIGCKVTRNSKQIKTTLITAEQYFRDQPVQHTDDSVDRQYETLSMDKVQSNNCNKRREETHTNKNSDIQIGDTQGHTINIVPNSRKLTEDSEQTVSDQCDQSVTVTNKMITSTLKHNIAGSAGDQTDLYIDNLHMHM